MPRIIDLDLIAPDGVTIRKDGQEYQLPGDPPTTVWLAIVGAYDTWVAAEGADSNEALGVFHDRMLALFRIEQPDMEGLPFGPAGMFAVLAGFYGADVAEEDPPGADEAASTTTTSNGSNGSAARTRKTTTRSRSSRSSVR